MQKVRHVSLSRKAEKYFWPSLGDFPVYTCTTEGSKSCVRLDEVTPTKQSHEDDVRAGLVSVVVPAHWAAVSPSCLSITGCSFSRGPRWPVTTAKVRRGSNRRPLIPCPLSRLLTSLFRTAVLTALFLVAFKSFVLSKVQVRLLAITVLLSSASDTSWSYCLPPRAVDLCRPRFTTTSSVHARSMGAQTHVA